MVEGKYYPKNHLSLGMVKHPRQMQESINRQCTTLSSSFQFTPYFTPLTFCRRRLPPFDDSHHTGGAGWGRGVRWRAGRERRYAPPESRPPTAAGTDENEDKEDS